MIPYTPGPFTQCYFPLSSDLVDASGKGHVLECYNNLPIFETVSGRPGFKSGTSYNRFLVAKESCGMSLGASTFMFWVSCIELPYPATPYQFATITIGSSGLNLNIGYFNNSDIEYNLVFERFLGQSSNYLLYQHTVDIYHHIAVTVVPGVSVNYYLDGGKIYSAAPVGISEPISEITNCVFGNIDTNTYTQSIHLSEIVIESQTLSDSDILSIYTQGV